MPVRGMWIDSATKKAVCNDEEQACVAEFALWKLEKIRKTENRSFKRETKRRKEAAKTRTEIYKDLEKEVNRFILIRDKGRPCCTCGTTSDIKYDAGHYRSVGSCKELRFELTNIHRQCSVQCNQHGSGMRKEYQEFLIDKYGQDHTEWLNGPHPDLKEKFPTHDDIRAEIKRYRKLNREAKL